MSTNPSQDKNFRMFHSSLSSMKYIFKDGMVAVFMDGKYYTDRPDQIAELETEIRTGNPIIRNPPEAGKWVSEADLNPFLALKARIREELMAEMALQESENRKLPDGAQERLVPASSTDIAPLTMNPTPVSPGMQMLQARLAAVTQQNAPKLTPEN